MQAKIAPGTVIRRNDRTGGNVQNSKQEGPNIAVGRQYCRRKAHQRTEGRNEQKRQLGIFAACFYNGNADDNGYHKNHQRGSKNLIEFLFVHNCKDSSIRLASGALPRKDAKSS